MLRITYPVALTAVGVLAMLPTAIAIAFMNGPAYLLMAPFSPKIALFGALAVAVILLTTALKATRAGKKELGRYLFTQICARPMLIFGPLVLVVLTAYPSSAFSFFKNEIPNYVSFYADPAFVSADRWLFLSADPWRISHALLGPYGTVILDKLYIAWFGLIPLLAVWIIGSTNRSLQFRGVVTIFFIWIVLGNYMAMVLSSCGPVFYEEFYGSDYYLPLMAQLREANEISPLAMLPIADWLLEMSRSGGFGTGISAMPSVHVAIAFFAFLVVKDHYPKSWALLVAGSFAFLIWVGSFHLAWHYAWDGIVSIIAVWAFWRLLGFVEVIPAGENAASSSADQYAGQQA